MRRNIAPSEDEVRNGRYRLQGASLTIGEAYKNVEKIILRIVDAYSKDRIGEQYEYSKSTKAFFYIDCRFSECYGYNKGFDVNKQIREAINNHEEVCHIKIACGGKGDMSLQYSCDDYLELEVNIQYS